MDIYLRFAEATNRLDLYDKGGKTLPDIAEGITEHAPDGPHDAGRASGGAGPPILHRLRR